MQPLFIWPYMSIPGATKALQKNAAYVPIGAYAAVGVIRCRLRG